MRKCLSVLIMLFFSACSLWAAPASLVPTATIVAPTSLPTQTLAPYEQYTIDYLRRRSYGGGKLQVVEMLDENEFFSSYAIRYPSDGLTIYGFITVPKGAGPFPVIVSVHGYAPDNQYDVYNTTYDFADYFAENGFIVIHPGLRNYPPSDSGENTLRVGMTVDVMNLIALIKSGTDLPAELANANTNALGLWGTSLGGEIALRVITISSDIKATVLYSALGGNVERNSRQLYEVLRDEEFQKDAQVPIELMDHISPMYYYHLVTSAVQIHHGTEDTTAPISWAVETCEFLTSAGVSTQCIYYEGAKHAFNAENNKKIRLNALEFFQLHLGQ